MNRSRSHSSPSSDEPPSGNGEKIIWLNVHEGYGIQAVRIECNYCALVFFYSEIKAWMWRSQSPLGLS